MSQVCAAFVATIQALSSTPVGRIPRPYDLLWPVARRKETRGSASVTASVVEVKKALHPPVPGLLNTPERTNSGTAVISSRTRLGTYAALLLDDNVSEALPGAISQLSLGSLQDEDHDSNFAPGLEKYSCRQSVDVMTRNPKKGKSFISTVLFRSFLTSLPGTSMQSPTILRKVGKRLLFSPL